MIANCSKSKFRHHSIVGCVSFLKALGDAVSHNSSVYPKSVEKNIINVMISSVENTFRMSNSEMQCVFKEGQQHGRSYVLGKCLENS